MDNESTVNIPLLRKAVEWAEAEAARGDDQSQWQQFDYISPAGCGSAYCIAGWVLHEAGWSDTAIDKSAGSGAVAEVAGRLLGIPVDLANVHDGSSLFHGDNTIEDVRRIAEELAGERL